MDKAGGDFFVVYPFWSIFHALVIYGNADKGWRISPTVCPQALSSARQGARAQHLLQAVRFSSFCTSSKKTVAWPFGVGNGFLFHRGFCSRHQRPFDPVPLMTPSTRIIRLTRMLRTLWRFISAFPSK